MLYQIKGTESKFILLYLCILFNHFTLRLDSFPTQTFKEGLYWINDMPFTFLYYF